ncbi:Nmad5 family putative nucleotide modification protein [Aeromonas hydrophila]|uniref:Nmad5 family putative nucleotide modification protein n=1 Tax=Aeromonas hydrophila TaxID=644 RepID=UPI002B46CD0F|nr:Nmad5 family putative nucleotide modification protein [Aeromonas hydrophila]
MKLTNQIKQQIVAAAIAKAGIPAEEEALRLHRAAWAEACRIDALGGKQAAKQVDKVIEEVERIRSSLPEKLSTENNVVRHGHYIYLNLAGITVLAYFSGMVSDKGQRVTRPTIYCHTLLADHPLVSTFHALAQEQDELNQRRNHLHAHVTAALANIHSDTKLLKIWPEAAELLPAEVKKVQLPALPTADLNALIGLPSEQGTAA